jgi:hypothetical protein
MSRLLREPLLHFLVAGALLFIVFDWVRQDPPEADVIVVDSQRAESLAAQFERTWGRPPTPPELEGLIENWVQEEMLYREGLALGLQRSDPVVRRRIAQQMQFIAESLVEEPPGDDELQTWLDAHRDQYLLSARYSFRQIYFNPDQYGDELIPALTLAKEALLAGEADAASSATMLPGEVVDASPSEIERAFGADFAAGLEGQPIGEWLGPVRSGFGLHLVYIDSKKPAREPQLAEVRTEVERDFAYDRNQRDREELIENLKQSYIIQRQDQAFDDNGAAGQSK